MYSEIKYKSLIYTLCLYLVFLERLACQLAFVFSASLFKGIRNVIKISCLQRLDSSRQCLVSSLYSLLSLLSKWTKYRRILRWEKFIHWTEIFCTFVYNLVDPPLLKSIDSVSSLSRADENSPSHNVVHYEDFIIPEIIVYHAEFIYILKEQEIRTKTNSV